MDTDLRKQANNDFENDFFKLKKNGFFFLISETMRKHRDIKLATTEERRIV